jgi:hypothetical protein
MLSRPKESEAILPQSISNKKIIEQPIAPVI